MNQAIKELTPFINNAISSIFDISRNISSYDYSSEKFNYIELFLLPTSFDVETQCIHFTPEFIDDEKDFSFFDKNLERRIKNIIRLINYFGDVLMVRHRLSITFDQHWNIKSFKLIINFISNKYIDTKIRPVYIDPIFTEKLVIRFESINGEYINTNNNIFFEKLEEIQKNILLAYIKNVPDFSLDFSQEREDFEKNLLVLGMYKI